VRPISEKILVRAEGGPLARRLRAERGFTLIEITIALAIAAVLFAGVITGIGSLTGAKAKQAAGQLAGTIRSLYDTAALSGRTCRLVFMIPDPRNKEGATKYWAECAEGALTSSRDRDEELREATREEEERRKMKAPGIAGGRTAARDFMASDKPTLGDFFSEEKQRIEHPARYSAFSSEEIAPRELPSAIRLSVWTRNQRSTVDQGLAYLYFFPQGYTERAMVFIQQGGNAWTLRVAPLTGKTDVVPELLEVPRP
jgi:general secretion pathway protein H